MRNDLMVRSKYEKYEILLVWPQAEGTNKLSKTHDSVKTQVCLHLNNKKGMTHQDLHR